MFASLIAHAHWDACKSLHHSAFGQHTTRSTERHAECKLAADQSALLAVLHRSLEVKLLRD
jgi:hypothetical protein